MPTIRPFNRTFLRGLQTTRPSDGADSFSGFRVFQNVRTHRDEAELRPGRALLQNLALDTSQTVMRFDGVDFAQASRDPRAWGLEQRKRWVLDILFRTDSAGDAPLLVTGIVSFDIDGSRLVASINQGVNLSVALTSTTVVTDGARHHGAVLRDGASGVSLVIDGVVEDSAVLGFPIEETDLAAFVNIGPTFDGDIDCLRLRMGSHPINRPFQRLLNPRGRSVHACWRNGPDADGIIYDHSIYENHARAQGPGVTLSTAHLSHPHAPVQAMRAFIDDENTRKLVVVAGGAEFVGAV